MALGTWAAPVAPEPFPQQTPLCLVSETINLLNSLSDENKKKVYFIHMNHTNSMLDPMSELSKFIYSKGYNIARVGQKIYL